MIFLSKSLIKATAASDVNSFWQRICLEIKTVEPLPGLRMSMANAVVGLLRMSGESLGGGYQYRQTIEKTNKMISIRDSGVKGRGISIADQKGNI